MRGALLDVAEQDVGRGFHFGTRISRRETKKSDVPQQPRVKTGSAVPPIVAVKADGTSIKLADYRGKYLLLSLVSDFGAMQQPQAGELMRMAWLADRFEDDEIVMLAVILPQRQTTAQRTIADVPGWIMASMPDWQTKLDPAYATSRGTYLIDPQGTVVAKVGPYANAAYGMVVLS